MTYRKLHQMTVAEILGKIKKKHVMEAIAWIDRAGYVPRRRNSTKFSLLRRNHRYPPKYVVAIAAFRATGETLLPDDHSGGSQSNKVLEDLGFHIISGATKWPER